MEEDEKRQHDARRNSEDVIYDRTAEDNNTSPQSGIESPSSDTDVESGEELQRIRTARSMAPEHEFEPIRAGDRAEVARVASLFQSPSIPNSTSDAGLTRRDTLYGVHIGHPALDPKSPEFDPYKWARM